MENIYKNSKNYKIYKNITEKFYQNTINSYEHLDIFNKILEEHNIEYIAVAGTSLGLNRSGGIILWVNDIDVGFIEKDWKKLHSIRNKLEISKLKYRSNGNGHCHYGLIDCFLLSDNGDKYVGPCGTICTKECFSNKKKQKFGPSFIYASKKSNLLLEDRYGKDYYSIGDVNDNFHYKNSKIKKFTLDYCDYSFQI